MAVQYIKARTILSRYKTSDPWFHIRYSMNLYRGCQHQCIYCDSRSKCYRIENFEDILIKENAIELLQKELKSLKERDTIGTGSMNDAYMPIEESEGLTRKALAVIARYKFPLHVITKSNLILRDTDIIKEISKVFATVSLTITCADDSLSASLEPEAPVSSLRFEAIKMLVKEKIHTGITLMPILPYINDSQENIKLIIEKAKEANAGYIIPSFGLTLRDKQRDYYFKKIAALFPDAYQKYQKHYRGQYGFMSPDIANLKKIFETLCAKYKINTFAPGYIRQLPVQQKLF